jgi:hypothetical protein
VSALTHRTPGPPDGDAPGSGGAVTPAAVAPDRGGNAVTVPPLALRPDEPLGSIRRAGDGEPDPDDQRAAYLLIDSGAEATLVYLLSIWASARPVEQWEGMGSLRRWVETLALGSLL